MYTYSVATIDDINLLLEKRLKERNFDSNYKECLKKYFDDFVSGKSIIFVAKIAGEPIGSINLEFCNLPDIEKSCVAKIKYCFLSTFKIEKKYRGQGHISKLIKMAENIAQELGYYSIIISCEETNQHAIDIYTHFGYDEIIMRKQINNNFIIYFRKILENNKVLFKNKPYVSIIVPVYNSSTTLCDTLNCILHQTYTNFELIVVDDGSSDSTLKMIYENIKEERRLKVIKQNHLGAGVARNKGLKAAVGKYVLFLDSDDLFLPNMLEILIKKADSLNAEIVIFGFSVFKSEPSNYIPTPYPYVGIENRLYSSFELRDSIFQKNIAAAWNKFYNRSFLINCEIEFQNLPFFNDEYFSRMSLLQSNSICYINEVLLFYRINSPNNIHSAKDGSVLFSCVVDCLYNTMNKKNIIKDFERSFSIYFGDIIYRALSHAGNKQMFVLIFAECNALLNRCKSGLNLSFLDDNKRNILKYILYLT